MPRGDRTGPAGTGPRTGRAVGYCTGYRAPGFLNPYGGRLASGTSSRYPMYGGRGRYPNPVGSYDWGAYPNRRTMRSRGGRSGFGNGRGRSGFGRGRR